MITFWFNDSATAVDHNDFGLLLSVVEGEVLEGTGMQVEGSGAADVSKGQGSDKFQVSSTSASRIIQAILYRVG
jgi:hypothetical protein